MDDERSALILILERQRETDVASLFIKTIY